MGRAAGDIRIVSIDRHQSNMLRPPKRISIARDIREAVAVPAKGTRIKNHLAGAGALCLVDNITDVIRISRIADPIENNRSYRQLPLEGLVPGFKIYIESQAHKHRTHSSINNKAIISKIAYMIHLLSLVRFFEIALTDSFKDNFISIFIGVLADR